jgi:hypothetical protein
MARIKARPRLAQPDPEPQDFSGAKQAMGKAISEYQLRSNPASDDEDSQNTDKQVTSKTFIAKEPERPRTAEDHSAAEQLLNIGQSAAITDLECPNCGSTFPDMRIKVSQISLIL